MVDVFNWIDAEGQEVGCGTAFELSHWQAEGVEDDSTTLGDVIGQEPAYCDENRKALWA